ncbi:MAG: VOC family protein [Alphaproteobacteria bacterium]|nr:VOC family protein [Alphaproteobacteria bacterium]
MTVRRIVPNFRVDRPREAAAFYRELFGLKVVMDQGWIVTLAGDGEVRPQMSLASEGGSDTPVPDVSIEVDDVDAVHERARDLGADILYPLTDEPWGVRRFYLRDPAGKVLNVLSHRS